MDTRLSGSNWIERELAWLSLVSSINAFLQKAIARADTYTLAVKSEEIETWQEFVRHDEIRRYEFEAVKSVLWCARQTLDLSEKNFNNGHISNIHTIALGGIPDYIRRGGAWAMDCINTFRRTNVKVQSASVHVALSDELLQDKGSVATLVLDIIHPGTGQVFHHPEDALETIAHSDFCESLEHAWSAALALSKAEGADIQANGRWRLLISNQAVKEIKGRSASGAALLGWFHTLNNTSPTDGVIVLAQIDENNKHTLKEVDGVFAKTKAIVRHGGFHTICVAGEKNEKEVKQALGNSSVIHVINLNHKRF